MITPPSAGVVWAALIALTATASAEISFKHHYIDDDGPAGDVFSATMLGDLDKDGRVDVVVGRSRWGKGPKNLYWYRNLGSIDRWSKPMIVNDQATCGCGGIVMDVDRDGWPDIVSGGLYRNPAPPGSGRPFSKSDGFLSKPNAEIHDMESADVNGDGRPDVIVHVQHGHPGIYVYLAPQKAGAEWTRVTALKTPGAKGGRSFVHAAVSPRGYGDIDGDGDVDIVSSGCWLENADGRGRQWTEHANFGFTRTGKWGRAVRCWVVDMDRDGHNDFVQAECDMPEARVAWFRNVNGDGSRWEMCQLPYEGTPGDFHSLAVADFDLDGDWDVYVDEMEHLHVPPGREGKVGMIVWENIDGKGRSWRQHMVVEGLGGHQAQIADLDGDGDMDIVTRPYKPRGNVNKGQMHVSVLENLTRNPKATGAGSRIGSGSTGAVSALKRMRAFDRKSAPLAKPVKAVSTNDLKKGLLAGWSFDEGSGGELSLCADGRLYADVGPLDVPGDAMTLAALFKADTFGGGGQDPRILSKAVGIQEQDHYWMISGWRSGKSVRLRFRLKAGGRTSTLVAASGDLTPGVWVHVAAVYDGRHMRLHKDGLEVGVLRKSGSIDTNPDVPVWIGDNPPDAGSRPFRGAIDDVRVYRRALDAAEVRSLAAGCSRK